jgi:hypothetical protein
LRELRIRTKKELALTANVETIPALDKVFIEPIVAGKGLEPALAVFDTLHAGGFAYAGSLATFVPGFLYVKGILDQAQAYDRYSASMVSCAAPIPIR